MGWILGCCLLGSTFDGLAEKGLLVTYRSTAAPGVEEIVEVDAPALYVPANQAPSPFLPVGSFEAIYTGAVQVDLRSDCSFKVDVRGTVVVKVKGKTVLEFSGTDESSPLSKPVRLSKGDNPIEILFSSPTDGGDAMLRMWWTDYESGLRPVSQEALARPEADAAAVKATLPRHGRDLFFELRCARCHTSPSSQLVPDGAMSASSFVDIGRRRNGEWLRRWVEAPRKARSQARMPHLLQGDKAAEEARLIGHFLSTLVEEVGDRGALKLLPGDVESGAEIYQKLNCASCHVGPDTEDNRDDEGLISLRSVSEKFAPGQLAWFLVQPEAHFKWIKMPNFGLSNTEARQLSAYLSGPSKEPQPAREFGLKKEVDAGRKLVQTRGCLNCHDLPGVENQYSARSLADLESLGGCLSEEVVDGVPDFSLGDHDREALAAFLKSGRETVGRYVPAEFARRQVQQLGCLRCHGEAEGFPSLQGIGGKLKPEWIHRFLAGKVPYKPRPWLEARMPRFSAHAQGLGEGLAALSGFAPTTVERDPLDPSVAEIGHKLVGKGDAFSCISCHAVGTQKPTDVFDGEGINLAYGAERLQYAFFRRWLLDPVTIDPETKMPDFFDGNESPLIDVYDGDAGQQVDAIWHYLRQGKAMPLPFVE